MISLIKKQPPGRIIACAFLLTILIGSVLLIMPFSLKEGVELKYIDALYTSTSAVCVTGLVPIDAGVTFSTVGQIVLALLIQVGGLGVTTIAAGIILLVGKKFNLKSINIVKEASNLDSRRGIARFVRSVFVTTVIIEGFGALLNFAVFVQDMKLGSAIWVSIFHAISAFNNAGFDILGGIQGFTPLESLVPYQQNVLLNINTCMLVILGGIGFLVIREIWQTRFNWKKFSMHTKIVLVTTAVLLISGTLLLLISEDISFMGAFFFSVSARTAGFATYNVANFSVAGLLVLISLMFIGASPGSTGGGIKTTTFFALLSGIKASATGRGEKAFKYAVPKDAFRKASVITVLAISLIMAGSFMIASFEPNLPLMDIVFEVTSAFATVGLSTGITPGLSVGSKIVSIVIMYVGRLGPFTIASLWYFSSGDKFRYAEGNIAIG